MMYSINYGIIFNYKEQYIIHLKNYSIYKYAVFINVANIIPPAFHQSPLISHLLHIRKCQEDPLSLLSREIPHTVGIIMVIVWVVWTGKQSSTIQVSSTLRVRI